MLSTPAYPASGPVKLRTNLADSALSRALKSGELSSPKVSFDFAGPKVAHDGFKPMVREGQFDAGELAIVTYLQARDFGKPLVLLPAAVVGRFQHHCIGYNAEKRQLSPKDIEGRRVAIRSYTQTTGVWVRGILQSEYGVDLDRVTWVCADDAHLAEYGDPPNVERLPAGHKKIAQMLLDGDVDAAILGNDMPNDPRIRPLIPNPHEAARQWYAKYGIVPINHMFVVNAELSRTRPDVVREAYRLLLESKKRGQVAKEGPDLLPFGFEANRKAIELAVAYALKQKIISRSFTVDELFDETTSRLGT
jgi:4,5-dihydroxyphthalate decarboxylase